MLIVDKRDKIDFLTLTNCIFKTFLFTPQPLRAVGYCFHPWCPDERAGVLSSGQGGWREKVCPGCISETVRCRKLILGRDIG